jgi:hypothetical protein
VGAVSNTESAALSFFVALTVSFCASGEGLPLSPGSSSLAGDADAECFVISPAVCIFAKPRVLPCFLFTLIDEV